MAAFLLVTTSCLVIEKVTVPSPSILDRLTSLGPGLPRIPERLLLAHARGEVLFIAGAGISQPAGLPDFRGLVVETYAKLDVAVHSVIATIPPGHSAPFVNTDALTASQIAEVKRFVAGDYDVVLGMLERRMDGRSTATSHVRQTIAAEVRQQGSRPAKIHRALMRLADRGGAVTIVTTNFDLLLENTCGRKSALQTYTLGGIPRPSRSTEFSGVLHIHGALDRDPTRTSDLIVSDQDFGEFYLRRRSVPDFIYDAARLFHLVLVGYSANDPPMRYLLNAVAADGSRFNDLRERFNLIGMTSPPDPVTIEDWKGRGITPIPYDSADNHVMLRQLLERWASLSAVNGKPRVVDSAIRRIVKTPRDQSTDADRDLFDHLVRRSNTNDRVRLSEMASKAKGSLGWLDAIADVLAESDRERR